MSTIWIRTRRAAVLAALLSIVVLAPASAAARAPRHIRTYGTTALALNPAAASALKSLGITPGLVKPAYARAGKLEFPVTTPFPQALTTGVIKHSGGISLTKRSTTVKLTNFWINLHTARLSANVGGERVAILKLDYRRARVRFSHGKLIAGPISARLTAAAASALDKAFKTTAFKPGLLLGKATINYRLSH